MSGSNNDFPMEEHTPLNSEAYDEEEELDCDIENEKTVWSSRNVILSKCLLAGVVLYAALSSYVHNEGPQSLSSPVYNQSNSDHRRRLTGVTGEKTPSYMNDLNEDLKARKKLFEDTPEEEIKYWFEYSGPLQVSTMEKVTAKELLFLESSSDFCFEFPHLH